MVFDQKIRCECALGLFRAIVALSTFANMHRAKQKMARLGVHYRLLRFLLTCLMSFAKMAR